jgi:pentatricopeptide repeat protein
MQDAATRGDEDRALKLLERYHDSGGEKQLWMFDMLINMHGRKRNLEGALAVRDLMHACGVKGSTCDPLHTFSYVMQFLLEVVIPIVAWLVCVGGGTAALFVLLLPVPSQFPAYHHSSISPFTFVMCIVK